MANKEKFKPLAGNTYVVKFKFDKPIDGESQYGKYYSYGVDVWEDVKTWKAHQAGKEMVWFTNERINAMLQAAGIKQGAEASVSVTQAVGKNDKPYNVYRIKFGGKEYCSDDYNVPKSKPAPQVQGYGLDYLADLMRACYTHAQIITNESKGEDTRAIAISLFITAERAKLRPPDTKLDTTTEPDQPPPPSDGDLTIDPDDQDLPF